MNWGRLNMLINDKKPDIILQCGDYGWWPHMHGRVEHWPDGMPKHKWDQFGLKPKNTKVYWCDGNHENHDDLDEKVKEHGRVPIEIMKNVFYMPRASTLTLPDGRNVLFMGGADSVDKHVRTEGVSWWRQEIINQGDIYALPDMKIDIVISHTIPWSIINEPAFRAMFANSPFGRLEAEPSTLALETVWEKYQPSLWYAGHWHVSYRTTKGPTEFFILNQITHGGYWKQVP